MTSGLSYQVEMLKAAREGRSCTHWVNDYKPGDGLNVVNMTGSFHNMSPGQQAVLTQISFAVISISDSCHFELGYTSEGYCSGTFTPIHHHNEVTTGAAKEYSSLEEESFEPPEIRKYSDGAKCICIRTDCSDADVEVTVGFRGWIETESS